MDESRDRSPLSQCNIKVHANHLGRLNRQGGMTAEFSIQEPVGIVGVAFST